MGEADKTLGTAHIDVVPELKGFGPAMPEEPSVVIETAEETITALPPGWRLEKTDHRPDQAAPKRSAQQVVVHDATSFLAAVTQRRTGTVIVYADESTNELVALLNDDLGEAPGWRDYRVALGLRATPEWTHWRGKDGVLMNQEKFAEHVEDGITELVEPEAATMMEIAQTFHATTKAKFRTARRLSSGEQQFAYDEEVEATAGTIEIPERLKLVLCPFYGTSRYEVGAWFRYRLTRDALTLGYKLDRPHEIERAAFADIRNAVETGLDDPRDLVINGPAPLQA